MSSVAVGEKLGGRYFIVRPIPVVQPGTFVEVRDVQGAVVSATFLGDKPLAPATMESVRAEISLVPTLPGFFLPDAVFLSTSELPAAVFLRAIPPALSTHFPSLAVAGVSSARRLLLTAFARLAEDLASAHAAKATHGAIALPFVLVSRSDKDLALTLTGFGVEAARRTGSAHPKPTVRTDLAALVLTLRDALHATHAEPDGAALARWAVLTNCARGGDHAALSSGQALAQHLREYLPPEPPRRMAPSVVPKTDATAAAPILAPVETPRRRFTVASRRPLVVVMGGSLTLVAAVALVVGYVHKGSHATAVRTAPTHSAHAACGPESMSNPLGIDPQTPVDQVDALCAEDGTQTVAVARAGHTVVGFARTTVRGGVLAWGPVTLAENVQELGTVAETPTGPWIALRTSGRSAFAITEVSALPRTRPFAVGGWSEAGFHGAYLLNMSLSDAAVATTMRTPGGPVAVVFRAEATGDTRSYKIADGEVLAAEAGDPAALLIGTHGPGGTTLQVYTVPVSSLAILASLQSSADGGGSDGGAPTDRRLALLPSVSVQRSSAFVVPDAAVTAAPYGFGHRYLVTVTAAGDSDGVVSLVSLPGLGHGQPERRALASHGRGMDLAPRGDHGVVALVTEDGTVSEYLLDAAGAGATAELTLPGVEHARTVSCGADTWVTYATSQPRVHIASVPLPCVSDRW